MTRILIADDHAVVRRGLKEIISSRKNLIIEAEASSGDQVIELLESKNIDFIIMDLSMPGLNGIELIKYIRNSYPRLPILVLSMHPEESYGTRVIKAGASGYLSKEAAGDELLKAIEKITSGGKYVSEKLAQQIFNSFDDENKTDSISSLSDREYEVMIYLAGGKSLKEIAELLYISPNTVSTYRQRILEKLNLKTNSELTLYAIRKNLIK